MLEIGNGGGYGRIGVFGDERFPDGVKVRLGEGLLDISGTRINRSVQAAAPRDGVAVRHDLPAELALRFGVGISAK